MVVGDLVALAHLDAQHSGQVAGIVTRDLRVPVADLIDKEASSHNERGNPSGWLD